MSSYARIRLALAALVVAVSVGVWTFAEAQRATVAGAGEQLRTSATLLTAMLDQETGLRGYDQTGLEEFLEPYRLGKLEFEAALASIQAQTYADDVVIVDLVRNQIVTARAWQARAEISVARIRRQGAHSATRREAIARRRLMTRFRQANAAFNRSMDRRVSEQLKRTRWVAMLFVLGFGATLLGVGFFAVERRARQDARRRRAEREFIETLQGARDAAEAQELLRRHVQRTVRGSSVVALRSGEDGPAAECLAIRRGRPYGHPPGADLLQPCGICGAETGAVTCEPSVVGGEVIGSLLVTRPQRMRPADGEAIAGAVNQAAPVLANLRNLAAAQHRAATDALTGLPNHRSMLEALERLRAGAARSGEPLAAVVLDLDHFKRLNDRYGHQAGDQVLAEVGRALRTTLRDADFVGRWGGEEFLLLLPGTDAEDAVRVAEKIRAAIAALVIAGVDAAVTGSFGVAAFPLHAGTGEGLVRSADEAMYRAKRAGRDRVALPEDPDPAVLGDLPSGASPAAVPRGVPLMLAPAPVAQDGPSLEARPDGPAGTVTRGRRLSA